MNSDTICALATAPGGALGIIRVSGSQAFDAVSSICSVACDSVATHTTHFTRIITPPPLGGGRGEVIDEALVTIFRTPHSYTGEDSVEISCHGSSYILNKVLELLIAQGCRMARPGEFTQRAFLNGKMDLSQAEAVADLIASTNKATHDIALSQLRGHFSSELKNLREQLLKLTSLLELELDFSDHEDLEFADRSELLQLSQQIVSHISRLADSFHTGNALKNGIPVAIIGAPNVGKSTLLNALVGEERAIVSDIQGTTRDAIEDCIQLGGITFRFIDTAGIRHTDDQIERMGIDRSIAAVQRAQIVLMMTEPGTPYPDVPIRDDQTIIRIENKTDLNSACSDSVATLSISAKYGIGLDALRQRLIDKTPKVADSDVIVTSARHYEALTHAHQNLQRVLDGLHSQVSGDLLAEDLRLVLSDLAEITGEGMISSQETLNNIFSHFCVGK
jgi:tRNA modification GTPase